MGSALNSPIVNKIDEHDQDNINRKSNPKKITEPAPSSTPNKKFLEQSESEDNEAKQKVCIDNQSENIIADWAPVSIDTNIRELLNNLSVVLPKCMASDVSANIRHANAGDTRKMCRSTTLKLRTYRLQGRGCSEMELAVANKSFIILHELFARFSKHQIPHRVGAEIRRRHRSAALGDLGETFCPVANIADTS